MTESPYRVGSEATTERDAPVYVGFWLRVWASVVDSLLLFVVTGPLLLAIYGVEYFESEQLVAGTADVLLNYVAPAVAVVGLWIYCQATPGKMAIHARVVDAKTGEPASNGQYVVRYLGYFVSAIPFGLGLLWVAFDPRKQGWHDKLAGTVVVRT